MWWLRYLCKRLRNGARITHQDGRVTKCRIVDDPIPPPFAFKRAVVVVVPSGVVVDAADTICIDIIPPGTAVRIATQGHLRA